MMSDHLTYLITGANRGLGKGFVQSFLAKPNTTVVAAVRDPANETSQRLTELPKAPGSKLVIVKLDSAIPTDAAEAVDTLKKEHGISALDVVIANAGIATDGATVRETTAANALQHFNVNTVGPLILFQATADLLQASKTGNPRFVAMSTLIGSIGAIEKVAALKFPVNTSYGVSKAALNWLIRRLHFDEPWLTTFVFHPGLVETDMASELASSIGLTAKDIGAITIDTSIAGMVKTIGAATREIGGTFQNYDGAINPW
jgi:norsolorinic acid ketoreductase